MHISELNRVYGPRRAGWSGLLFLCLAGILWFGCGGDEDEPATREDVVAACREYQEAACRAFARCVDGTPAQVSACIADGNSRCASQVAPSSCWEEQRAALEDCAADVEEESCVLLCDSDSCEDECTWICPAQPPGASMQIRPRME